jgi:hypothetical protein
LGAATLGGLVVTGVFFLRDALNAHRRARELQITLLLVAAVTLNFAGFIRFNLSIYQPQGRFLFPTLAPLLILSLFGIWRLLQEYWEAPAAGLLVGAMLAINLYVLTQVLYPGYYHRPLASAYQNTSSKPVGEIRGDKTHGQSFVARYDNLNRVDVMLATFARDNQFPVIFHLKRSPESNQDLVTQTIDASTVTDNTYHTFAFDPIPNSGRQTFYFYLESPESVPGDAITIWANPEDGYPSGTRYEGHIPATGDLRFTAFSTP